ncbi:MAG: amidohydrolase family protein [Firmicutes bacterium]|jgi:hypothetical protein|nr:amidohydrolase family protein [Bacillota bacterium]
MQLGALRHSLEKELEGLGIISCHEHHLIPERGELVTLDYIFDNSYVGWCGVDTGSTPDERESFIYKVGTNSYYRWLALGLQRLYGFDGELSAANWEEISESITSRHRSPDWYFHILHCHAGIEQAVLDAYWHPGSDNGHPEFYRPTFRINALVMSHSRGVKDHNGNNAWQLFAPYGMEPSSFAEYLEAVEFLLTAKKQEGCVALKCALAYDRSMAFDEAAREDAEAAFGMKDAVPKQVKAFQDYVFHFIVERAGALELPLQCHVGLGKIGGSNPMYLVPLIEKHPGTKFVLFHGGYPWTREIGGLLHNYPNVYADLVWLPLISPTAAVQALHEWIETAVTSEKITWGGDCWTPEETFGAVLALRWTAAKALADKVQDGYFSYQRALELARQIFSENARKLYGI